MTGDKLSNWLRLQVVLRAAWRFISKAATPGISQDHLPHHDLLHCNLSHPSPSIMNCFSRVKNLPSLCLVKPASMTSLIGQHLHRKRVTKTTNQRKALNCSLPTIRYLPLLTDCTLELPSVSEPNLSILIHAAIVLLHRADRSIRKCLCRPNSSRIFEFSTTP